MSVLTALPTITRDEAAAELAKPGGRIRFLFGTGEDDNGGFIVQEPEDYHNPDNHWVADVREGWAGGVMEAVCEIGASYLFDSYLSTAATWIDRGTWVRVRIEGCSGGPDEHISTR